MHRRAFAAHSRQQGELRGLEVSQEDVSESAAEEGGGASSRQGAGCGRRTENLSHHEDERLQEGRGGNGSREHLDSSGGSLEVRAGLDRRVQPQRPD